MLEKIKLNTNLVHSIFTGTYESPYWDLSNEEDDNGNSIYAAYDHKDLMESIVKAYQSQEQNILSEIDINFITNLHFLDTFYSPREYNFSTDQLDIEITIDMSKLYSTLDTLAIDSDFEKYLHDNYSSYDGFMSFTPNNYETLRQSIVSVDSEYHQSIGAVISYLIGKNFQERNVTNTIEADVWEHWQGNGYEGLDYTYHCYECDKEVLYENNLICDNTDCKRSTRMEAISKSQQKIAY